MTIRICRLWAVAVLLWLASAAPAAAQTAIGRWRDCPDLTRIHSVVAAGDRIYGAGQAGILCFDVADRTLSTLSRSSGLSDAGISFLAFDSATRCLLVIYNNSNIDLLAGSRIYNLSDIKRSEAFSYKEIYGVAFADSAAYLATGFGVVVVDLRRREIRETWLLGDGGSPSAVYALAFSPDSIYAATAAGIKRLARSEPFPSIADRWVADTRLAGTVVDRLAFDGRRLWAAGYTIDPGLHDVYVLDSADTHHLHNGILASLRSAAGYTTVCLNDTVFVYDTALSLPDTLVSYTWGPLKANDAVAADDGTIWTGNSWDGITGLHPDGTDETHRPDSPAAADNIYRLVPFANRMMLCPGGHNSTFGGIFIPADLCTTTGRHWQSLNRQNGMLDNKYDVVDAAVNPRDTNETVVALWGTGIAVVRDNEVVHFYTDTNTGGALQRYSVGSYNTLRTGTVAFDRKGNLWTTVSHSSHALAVRRSNGRWESFSTTAFAPLLQIDKMVCDSVRGYIWMSGSDNAIYVHDGESRLARVNPNNGSKMQTESVNAMAQDQNGNIWIGTNKGIKVIYDGYNAFRNGGNGETAPVTCSNITISNGDFAEYLMAYENITAIAVDGANRKWVGTAAGGLYLLSANGLDQLQHFTTTNSPLFSDKVLAIGIHSRNGDVYVGTDRGLQVYRSTATYAEAAPREEVYAYPNPVRPGYEGPIAIKGFTRNALVHITDAAGHTVYSTQAYGGQAIWDGRTTSGEQVASGVYYVFASDAEGGNRSVTKILIVR